MDDSTIIDFSQPPHPEFRAGMVAVVGAANAGKSSLVNFILDEKVSIVSSVAQTTRNLVRGIYTDDDVQLVFLDTPGVHRAQASLGKQMNKIARTSIAGTDVVLLVMDRSRKPALEVDGWMRRLAQEDERMPVLFVLNKTDCKSNHADVYRDLWKQIQEETGTDLEPGWHEVSAETGDQADALKKTIASMVPKGPLLFPEEILTDFPKKLNIGDVIREKYFLRLKDELPHSLAVWVDSIDERPKEWRAEIVVYVQRSSQKGIVIGNKGRLLKTVRAEAEKELSDMYEIPVRLHFNVKVEKHWDQNFWILRKLGYA